MTPEEDSRGLRVWCLVYREINCECLRSNQHLRAQADDACRTIRACDGDSDDSNVSRNSRIKKTSLCQAGRQFLLFSLVTYD